MLLKRLFDIFVSLTALIVLSPFLVAVAIAIWLQDYRSPFYKAPRVARGGGLFIMMKFRSMVMNADKSGVNSTAGDDRRITAVGRFVRRYKIDELSQLWNVLFGDMSLVGPRPQVKVDADLYTAEERRMLTVRPGITDLASIVFSDEGDVLHGSDNPDLLYNQIIRPWKSRLALLYVERRSFFVDLRIILLTAVAILSRPHALAGVQQLLQEWDADPLLLKMAARQERLMPYPPPGADSILSAYR